MNSLAMDGFILAMNGFEIAGGLKASDLLIKECVMCDDVGCIYICACVVMCRLHSPLNFMDK